MTDASPARANPRIAFRYPDFRHFQGAKFLFTVGWQMQTIAVGYHIYEHTGQALLLGYAGLAQFLPRAGFVLLAGHVADRYDRRRLVLLCMLVLVACSAGLAALSLAGLPALWPVYALLFVVGSAHAFLGPASSALLPTLVPPAHFPNAVAWNSSIWQLAAITGPGLGGLVYGWTRGATTVYAMDAAFTFIGVLLMLRVRPRTQRAPVGATNWTSALAGVRYVFQKKIILGSISLDLFAVLFGGAVALLPIYARDILKIGPTGMGLLRAAQPVGAATMAVALAHLPPMRRAGATMLCCVAAFGVATIVFGLSRNVWLTLVCLVIMGACDMVSVVVRHTLVQVLTPDSMRGRVSAVNLVFIGASNELGEFESGLTAHWFGTVPAVVIGGCGTLLVVGAWSLLFPGLRRFRRLDTAHEPDEVTEEQERL